MDLSDGYIGIANDPEVRWKQHEHCAHSLNHRYVVYQQMRNHKGNYIKTIIDEGTREYVSRREFELRPEPMMGWNMAAGGGNPIVIWRQPDDWISNELWHPEHGDEYISGDYTLSDWSIKYYNLPGVSNGDRAELGKVLKGIRHHVKGWQLRDAQLAISVKTWLEEPWEECYLSGYGTVIHLTRENSKQFLIDYPSHNLGFVRELVKGIKKTCNGWQLSSESEYNETSMGYRN